MVVARRPRDAFTIASWKGYGLELELRFRRPDGARMRFIIEKLVSFWLFWWIEVTEKSDRGFGLDINELFKLSFASIISICSQHQNDP